MFLCLLDFYFYSWYLKLIMYFHGLLCSIYILICYILRILLRHIFHRLVSDSHPKIHASVIEITVVFARWFNIIVDVDSYKCPLIQWSSHRLPTLHHIRSPLLFYQIISFQKWLQHIVIFRISLVYQIFL